MGVDVDICTCALHLLDCCALARCLYGVCTVQLYNMDYMYRQYAKCVLTSLEFLHVGCIDSCRLDSRRRPASGSYLGRRDFAKRPASGS